jgi:hypothetical protein
MQRREVGKGDSLTRPHWASRMWSSMSLAKILPAGPALGRQGGRAGRASARVCAPALSLYFHLSVSVSVSVSVFGIPISVESVWGEQRPGRQTGIAELADLGERVCVDQGHDHAVPVLVQRLRHLPPPPPPPTRRRHAESTMSPPMSPLKGCARGSSFAAAAVPILSGRRPEWMKAAVEGRGNE